MMMVTDMTAQDRKIRRLFRLARPDTHANLYRHRTVFIS